MRKHVLVLTRSGSRLGREGLALGSVLLNAHEKSVRWSRRAGEQARP
jgi:hypothetical protein